jgi:hypothetical protein
MQITGQYKFPNHSDVTFENPTIEIGQSVRIENPDDLEIFVDIYIPMEGSANGRFWVDINPVPVKNLNYDGGELVDRILERLEDFKI